MKRVSVKDDNGKVYEFETSEDVVLVKIVIGGSDNAVRILGYGYSTNGYIMPKTWNLEGSDQWRHANSTNIKLTPYDKFKDLKKAFSEGAKVEMLGVGRSWREKYRFGWTSPLENYRIKDNISIESWNTHKDVIKEYWNGGEVEWRRDDLPWNISEGKFWQHNEYRIKPQQPTEELTLEQVCEALGRDIKIVKG